MRWIKSRDKYGRRIETLYDDRWTTLGVVVTLPDTRGRRARGERTHLSNDWQMPQAETGWPEENRAVKYHDSLAAARERLEDLHRQRVAA